MAPKKHGGRDTPQNSADERLRPRTPNDRALEETERELRTAEETQRKWEERLKQSQDASKRNDDRIAVVEQSLATCDRLLRELEDQCGQIIRKRAEAEAMDIAAAQDAGKGGGAKKAGGKAPTPEPAVDLGPRAEEVQVVTDLLMKFYHFDGRDISEVSPSKVVCGAPIPPGDIPELARKIKADAQKDVDAAREAEEAAAAPHGKPAPKRGGSAGKSKTAGGEEEARPTTPESGPIGLPAPKGVDRAVWMEVLRLRTKRVQVDQAAAHLRCELTPLVVRKQGLDSMGSLTDYAIEAAKASQVRLSEKKKKVLLAQQADHEKWKEGQKKQEEAGGKPKKK